MHLRDSAYRRARPALGAQQGVLPTPKAVAHGARHARRSRRRERHITGLPPGTWSLVITQERPGDDLEQPAERRPMYHAAYKLLRRTTNGNHRRRHS
jgi:hypothetical protein